MIYRFQLFWIWREIPKDPSKIFKLRKDAIKWYKLNKIDKKNKWRMNLVALLDKKNNKIEWLNIWGDEKKIKGHINTFVAAYFEECNWKRLFKVIEKNGCLMEFREWAKDIIWRIERTKLGEGYRCLDKFYEAQYPFLKWYLNNSLIKNRI